MHTMRVGRWSREGKAAVREPFDGEQSQMGRFQGQRGFTLLELTVVVAIIVALAAVVIPMVGQAKRDGQVADVLQLIDSVRNGAMKYNADTGKCAEEFGSSTADGKHQLFLSQSVTGWNGPYIDHALSRGDNPYGGYVNVYNTLDSSIFAGFDLVGRGSNTAKGIGNFLRISNFPEDMAQLVNDALDDGIGGDWKATGRVQWKGGKLDVFLLDVDGK